MICRPSTPGSATSSAKPATRERSTTPVPLPRNGQSHEADPAVAHWLQHTSRDGDMQLHVHSQIAHTARTITDGNGGPGLLG